MSSHTCAIERLRLADKPERNEVNVINQAAFAAPCTECAQPLPNIDLAPNYCDSCQALMLSSVFCCKLSALHAASCRNCQCRLMRLYRQGGVSSNRQAEFQALAAISEFGRDRLHLLAEHEGVSRPTMSRLVNALEAKGLIEKQTDVGDRRAPRLAITRFRSHCPTSRVATSVPAS